ncbi:hypothetical protein Tco_0740458, partial [Tanacetum coccineum]
MMMASVKIHASIDGHSLSQSLKFSLRRHLKLDDPRWITLSSTYIDISSNCLLWDMKQTSDRYPFQKGAFSPQWRIEEQCMRNKGLKLLELQQIARQWEEEVKSKESLISLFNLWMKAKATNKTDWNDPSVLRIDQGVGSTSGIRACALRYFDLGNMELENSQNNSLAKLPILKLGEYEMWEIRIKQYFQIQDYALWEVIEYGNSWVPIPITTPESGPSTALKMTVPSTTEEKICKKNDVKARSLLLMALPNEHQLTFNQYADAQSMFIAIKARFG